MAKEPIKPKAGKPSLDTPTRIEEPGAAPKKVAPKTSLAKPTDAPAPKKPAQTASVQGKIVRKDSPVINVTNPAASDTVGPEMQKDTNKASEGPVQKPADSLEASMTA